MIKQRKNKERGITLIALVVTIVVLLILAGVTITYVLGDNGIFKLAQDAKDKMEEAKKDEQAGMNKVSSNINKWANGEKVNDEIIYESGIWRAKKSAEVKCSNLEIQVYSMYYNVDDINQYKEKYVLKQINEVRGTEFKTLDEFFRLEFGIDDKDIENALIQENLEDIYISKEDARKLSIFLIGIIATNPNDMSIPEELLQEMKQCNNDIEKTLKFIKKNYADIALYGWGYTKENIEQIEQEYINNHTEKEIPQEIKNATYTITYPNGSTEEILGSDLNKVKISYKVEENGNNSIKIANSTNAQEEVLNIQVSNIIKNAEDEWYNYTFSNSLGGYKAKVKDTTLTSYGKIQSNLNGVPLVSLSRTFQDCENLTNFSFAGIDTSKVVDMSYMFLNCKSLASLNVSELNTTKVINMSGMFRWCESLNSLDVSKFNTSKVIDMSEMFFNCKSLKKLDVSKFNTSNVISMVNMFYLCENLTNLDVSKFNTINVTSMVEMFGYCESLTSLDLSNFNTTKVTNMYRMFVGCESLTNLYLSEFNTTKVTNIYEMFEYCTSLTELDLSSFNTSKVTNMQRTFKGCTNLATIYVGEGWKTEQADITDMFLDCKAQTTTSK